MFYSLSWKLCVGTNNDFSRRFIVKVRNASDLVVSPVFYIYSVMKYFI